MNNRICFIATFACFAFACTTTQNATTGNKSVKANILLQAGVSHGGIVENTNLESIDNIAPDAFSGATKTGLSGGIHSQININGKIIETGVDVITSSQTFTYSDNLQNLNGDRYLNLTQIRIPLTYNFQVMKSKKENGLFQVKLGYTFGYNHLNVNNKTSSLPVYSYNKFTSGPTLGFQSHPFSLNDKFDLGMYCDFYRGSPVYKDFYNNDKEETGSSYLKAGITFYLK